MTSWLTFVVGVIVGLIIGWLMDMFYRRAPRPEPVEHLVGTPEWAQPLPATPAPELTGTAVASTAAVAGTAAEDALDVPPGSETAEATEEVDWRAISDRVDEVAAGANEPEVATPHLRTELPEEAGLPPSAAETLAPPPEDDGETRG
jgi:hypothetical protein